MTSTRSLRITAAMLVAGAALVSRSPAARAATVVIDNADPAGQGLNDPTAVVPVGGNPATTLGAARLAVLQQAGALWAAQLSSVVPIHIHAQMTPLTCTMTSSLVAVTSVGSLHRDFPSAPRAATWYPQALANAIARTYLDPATPDIQTSFNGAQGSATCQPGTTFYLGLDGRPARGQLDLLTIALHEFAHGLGFLTYTDLSTGAKFSGLDDPYLLAMRQLGATPSEVSMMTDAQRVTAAVSEPNLYWTSPTVDVSLSGFSAGLTSGHLRLYAPPTYAPASSIVHCSNAVSPNQLMEPFYAGPNHDIGLTVSLLRDLGWSQTAAAQAVPALPAKTALLLALLLLALGARLATGVAANRSQTVHRA